MENFEAVLTSCYKNCIAEVWKTMEPFGFINTKMPKEEKITDPEVIEPLTLSAAKPKPSEEVTMVQVPNAPVITYAPEAEVYPQQPKPQILVKVAPVQQQQQVVTEEDKIGQAIANPLFGFAKLPEAKPTNIQEPAGIFKNLYSTSYTVNTQQQPKQAPVSLFVNYDSIPKQDPVLYQRISEAIVRIFSDTRTLQGLHKLNKYPKFDFEGFCNANTMSFICKGDKNHRAIRIVYSDAPGAKNNLTICSLAA